MLNCAVIMGRLVADPELRTTPNGISVTSFCVAVDRSFVKAGERERPILSMSLHGVRRLILSHAISTRAL